MKEFFSFFVFLVLIFALCSGVEYNGKHYGLDLDCSHGVIVHAGDPAK